MAGVSAVTRGNSMASMICRSDQLASNVSVAGESNSSLPSTVAISSLYLYMALEVDPDVCKQLVAKVNSGMSQRIPYINTFREAYTGNTYNRSLRFNSSHEISRH